MQIRDSLQSVNMFCPEVHMVYAYNWSSRGANRLGFTYTFEMFYVQKSLSPDKKMPIHIATKFTVDRIWENYTRCWWNLRLFVGHSELHSGKLLDCSLEFKQYCFSWSTFFELLYSVNSGEISTMCGSISCIVRYIHS